jgi:predicted ATPase with chaperone activity
VHGLSERPRRGLADAAMREARERITAAILNSGYEFPDSWSSRN